MMQQTRLKYSIIVVLLSIGLVANSQQFRYSAKLDTIPASGFYTIILNAEVLSYLRTDYADLRIEDKDRKLVPYLIRDAGWPFYTPDFTEFPIISNRPIDSGKTEIILSNDSAKLTTNIKLFIKNAAVSRLGSLSGSNDGKKWFIIDDQILIGRSNESVKDEYLQEIHFPGSKYRFYKLVIDNQKNDPMNIFRAGNYYIQPFSKRAFQYEDNPSPELKVMDSGKYSLVNVRFNRPYHMSRFRINVSGAEFFKREFQLYSIDSATSTRRFIGDFSLVSKSDLIFDFPLIKTSQLQLIIDNKDNPPLSIDHFATQHILTNATAYLDKNNSYRILLENPEAKQPDYDLVHFKDSIRVETPVLIPHSIAPNETLAQDSQGRKWWIWPVLIGVLAIMGLLTYKLSGDVKFNVNA